MVIRSTCHESHSDAICRQVSRRLPGGLPLKSVKLIACQLFKVEPTRQQLLYTPPGGEKARFVYSKLAAECMGMGMGRGLEHGLGQLGRVPYFLPYKLEATCGM